MIKYLAFEYQSLFSFLNIFSYITFRAGASILTGLFFSLIFGNYIINKLSNVQPTGQPIRDDGPESHIIAKKGTPTMGGMMIILSVFVSTIIWADLQNIFIWILLSTILIFGSIGFADDYSKIKSKIFVKSKYDTNKKKISGVHSISSVSGYGIEALVKTISSKLKKKPISGPVFSRERHMESLNKSLVLLKSLDLKEIDIAAENVRRSIMYIDGINQKFDIEKILDIIFSDFCIGK